MDIDKRGLLDGTLFILIGILLIWIYPYDFNAEYGILPEFYAQFTLLFIIGIFMILYGIMDVLHSIGKKP